VPSFCLYSECWWVECLSEVLMYSVFRLFLILRLLSGDGWGWRLRIILSAVVFWVLIYSIMR
jgi:hypothetical protein